MEEIAVDAKKEKRILVSEGREFTSGSFETHTEGYLLMKTKEYVIIALLLWWAFRNRLASSSDVHFQITEPGFEGTEVGDVVMDYPPTWNWE